MIVLTVGASTIIVLLCAASIHLIHKHASQRIVEIERRIETQLNRIPLHKEDEDLVDTRPFNIYEVDTGKCYLNGDDFKFLIVARDMKEVFEYYKEDISGVTLIRQNVTVLNK